MNGVRPRVLHIVDDLNGGGLQRNLLKIIERTADRFDHQVCCVREPGLLLDRFEAACAPVAVLGIKGRDRLLAARIAMLCRRLRPHLVHTRNWGTVDGIIGARLARVPAVVHSEHGRDRSELSRRRLWTLRGLSFLVNAFAGVSEDLVIRLRRDAGIRPDKVWLLRNGVDSARFRPAANRDALRRERGWTPSQQIVLAVGRLDPVKNHCGLIRAFALVRPRRPQARLVLAGEGPDRQRIEAEVVRCGLAEVVDLAGHQENVEHWLAAADVFVHPSLFEGMANGVLEAMASGLPLVATRAGGLRELVVDGVTGTLVPPGDDASLARAIDAYCGDPQLRLERGAAGRRRVLAEFTVEAMLDGYVALYERVLGSPSGKVIR